MKKILIVEDEQDIVQFLKTNLERAGFDVNTATTGKEAIAKVKTFKPQCVVLDIMLPEMDGLAVLKWIRANASGTFTILATAKSELQDIKKGYAEEADCYITKPYKPKEIINAINVLSLVKKNQQ